MAKINFNVNAYTARLIGRENVSKLSGAILELVKNSYDADASVCILYYEISTNTLYLIDNGQGMTEKVIKESWMTIGYSIKKNTFLSKKGRVQTGAKGIGRFALDRIADTCEMFTVSSHERIIWNVSWKDFSEEKNITDVNAEINEADIDVIDFLEGIKNKELLSLVEQKFITGTIFKITSLRDKWDENTITSIKKNLNSLIPFEYKRFFDILFFEENSSIEEAEIIKDKSSFEYDYKIEFSSLENQKVLVKIFRNEFDFGMHFDNIIKEDFKEEDREYFLGKPIIKTYSLSEISSEKEETMLQIGKFEGVLYFSKQSYSRKDKEKYFYKPTLGKSCFSENMSGIKLYRDNFRVRPYGEYDTSSYDWLQLAQRRNSSPAAISHPTGKWRVAPNQMMGSVFISRMNVNLPDQSNREGIIETKEFSAFRDVLCGIIALFESDRQRIGRILYQRFLRISRIEQLEKEIKDKAKLEKKTVKENEKEESDIVSIDFKSDIHVAASDAEKVINSKQTIIDFLEDENMLLRVLATTGIVTNTYIHEFRELTHKLKLKIWKVEKALKIEKDINRALERLSEVKEVTELMNSWFAVTIETVKKDKRKEKIINLNDLIKDVQNSWNSILKPLHITIDFYADSSVMLKCFPFEIESIFSNLISNSKASFDNSTDLPKKISISISEDETYIYISYEDNGPGLCSYYKYNPERILEPFETDKKNELGENIGTGMGMWIIRKTIMGYNGKIDLSKNKTTEKGFYILMSFQKSIKE